MPLLLEIVIKNQEGKEMLKMFELFVYDNTSCDEYGLTCVTFSSTGLQTIASQESEIQSQKSVKNDIFHIVSQEYTKPLTYTLQVINHDASPTSEFQEREIKKWLCQKGKYKPFSILEKRYADTWFFANINNPKSIYICDTIGMEFTVTTNAPFAFSDLRDKTWIMEPNDIIEDFYVDSDEELPIYPDIIIIPNESGKLTLTNQSIADAQNTLIIENCVAGEEIIIECGYPHISSSIPSHRIFDDFNKYWPYLIDGFNRFSTDKACTIEFKYREYRKVGIV